ncbi:MAG TPA: flavin reductase family protein, partial [Acidimicrobiales bacterium]|nr:flavin reductase family protein [Acidimicrobiales bacterium]
GLFVVGSRAGDRRNAMTANWVIQIGSAPKLVGVSVEKEAVTHDLIAGSRAFVVNLLDRDDRAIVRKFTKPVEVEGATLNGFAFHDGRTGAPVLDQAVAYIECEVRDELDCGEHTLFVGEVVDAAFQGDESTDVLRMEDTRMNYGG